LRHWLKVPYERLLESDQIVLKTSNTILRASGAEPLKAFSDLFAAQETFLCTLPELDHYQQRTGATYWGAVYDTEMGEQLVWPEVPEQNDGIKRVLVYLEPQHRDFIPLLETIVAQGHVAFICAPGISDNQLKKYSHGKVRILNQPIKFSGLLEKCDLTICHGGHGTTAAMLRAGIPLLLFPNHLEQFLLAFRIKEMGMGDLVSTEDPPPPDMPALLSRMLNTREFMDNAQAFATKYQAYTRQTQLAQISTRIEALAAGK
jgi:UDP:flavonoid glycosyltransferase YjiC (YdhE family)